ncbi:MAG: ThuA domain-containing protein [Anditalea sp.]
MRNLLFSIQSSIKPISVSAIFIMPFCLLFGYFSLNAILTPLNVNKSTLTFPTNPDKKDEIPAVQVMVPGFSAVELPVSLTNINVVRYGSDGRLYALAYDGHIYVLTDTDGDGIEDKAEYWWDKKPLISPVGMVVAEEGIYVTALNKLSLIKDVDKDGKAETEEIITSDWIKPSVYTGTTATGVDAFGIAKDENGNIFFALGAADFTRAYMVDSLGNSHYDLKSQRGTVLKVTPGSKKREIFVTGTRFPVAMAFNKEGDLFATDQEGATWLPNGNPYDELIHIQEGRHYGFPPKHPKYLPNVIDEPSIYDYKPQHQSTTGLNFNLPVNNGPVFGPAWWEEDAIVTGYSRGKIYRTKLVNTPSGYITNNQVIASLNALTVDACISPQGDLIVATHSGPPDWGFGPQAEGKLYKIIYTNPDEPNPVASWASRPDQVMIAFDKPVSEDYMVGLSNKIEIEYGDYVEAGDRFEVVRPGYKAVERQMNYPREQLKVKNVELSGDGRTIILNTFTHSSPVTYAITLPAFSNNRKIQNGITQDPAIDLSYKLNGVEVNWQAKSGSEKWQGVIPHLDLKVSQALMKPALQNDDLNQVLGKAGTVTFKSKLNLWNMLRADIQPESTLDFKLPPEDVHLVFKSSEPLKIKTNLGNQSKSVKKGKLYETKVIFNQVAEQPYLLEVSMNTTDKEDSILELYYHTHEDSTSRALQIHRFFLPWLEDIYSNEISPVKEIPELEGGNWSRGKDLFFGESTCSNCHSVGGEGKSIGPDLSNLIFRDYTSVLRDIKEPSASINPDYLSHTVTYKDDRKLTGMISYKTDSLIIRDIADNKTAVPLKDVQGTTPLSVSLMPPGLDIMLGEQKMKDLMTYLLTSLQPAEINYPFLPPMKNASEVNAVLKNSSTLPTKNEDSKLLKLLWVSGPKDHGPDEHDYPLQQERWTQLLSLADNIELINVSQWPSPEQFNEADVIVFYWNYPEFNEENGKQLDVFLQKGGGLVYLHYAVDATDNPKALADRIGLAWKGGSSKFRHGRVELDFKDKKHPITKGFENAVFHDETYWQLVEGTKKINVLATAKEEGIDVPILWTTSEGKGRIFVSILGHYNWTFDDPLFRILILRSIAWTGNQSTDRFNDLATFGARVSK